MRIIRDFSCCPPDAKGAVLALGNFDGVHLGHRAILEACAEEADRRGVPAAVMTFSPHPREFFAPGATPLRLQGFRQKMESLAGCGIAFAFIVRFNARFAALPPQAFVAEVLHRDLGAQHVVTGYNFAFGRGREGDTSFLAAAARACGMGFTACAPVAGANGEAVSSSAIRALLREGRMREAAALLGRIFSIEGRVIHGDRRGGALGYPTANIALGSLFRPRYGVYAVRLVLQDVVRAGVANLGIRPMFALEEPLLEVHGFDMQRDLYGQRVRVELVEFIREERSFDSVEALKSQIAADDARARLILGNEEARRQA